MKFAEQVSEHGVIERQPLLEGKSMFIVMASTHKPKVHGAAAADGTGAAPEPESPAPLAAPAATLVAPTAEPTAAPPSAGD
jgi:hypothetical protein